MPLNSLSLKASFAPAAAAASAAAAAALAGSGADTEGRQCHLLHSGRPSGLTVECLSADQVRLYCISNPRHVHRRELPRPRCGHGFPLSASESLLMVRLGRIGAGAGNRGGAMGNRTQWAIGRKGCAADSCVMVNRAHLGRSGTVLAGDVLHTYLSQQVAGRCAMVMPGRDFAYSVGSVFSRLR